MEVSSGICAGGCIKGIFGNALILIICFIIWNIFLLNSRIFFSLTRVSHHRFVENLRHLVEKQFTYDWQLVLLAMLHILRLMSVERKNPLKRDQALNDATSGQIGEEPRPEPSSSKPTDINEQRIKAARKISRDL